MSSVAGTATPVSCNREARRIVDGLHNPDQSPEQLLEVVSFRCADGREVSLVEFSPAQALRTGETVRAEEIVIQAPDEEGPHAPQGDSTFPPLELTPGGR